MGSYNTKEGHNCQFPLWWINGKCSVILHHIKTHASPKAEENCKRPEVSSDGLEVQRRPELAEGVRR
jgi:hypothetical protein